MPKLRLTATAVERFQPPKSGQVEYYDTRLPAFGVRVSYSGTKAWFVMTRVDGKLTRVTLGRHPALSLVQARDKARRCRACQNWRRSSTDGSRGAPPEREGPPNHFRDYGCQIPVRLRRARLATQYRS